VAPHVRRQLVNAGTETCVVVEKHSRAGTSAKGGRRKRYPCRRTCPGRSDLFGGLRSAPAALP
jgi:hypothetical protein